VICSPLTQIFAFQTKAWVELNAAMARYYRIDRKKKIAAAIIIQRWVRHVQKKVFSYSRMMRTVDDVVKDSLEKIRAKAHAAKMLALAPEPGSLEEKNQLAASQAAGQALPSMPQSVGLPPPSEEHLKWSSQRRRRSEVISDFKSNQRNRLSVLIRPVTAGANFTDPTNAPYLSGKAAVFAPRPTHLLPVLLTPPDSPRDSETKVMSYRVIPKPVSVDRPAPFTGGPNAFLPGTGTSSQSSSTTFVTSTKMVDGQLLHQINEDGDDVDDEEYESDDGLREDEDEDEDDGFVYNEDVDGEFDDEELQYEMGLEYNMQRGESAPLLSRASPTYNNMKQIKQAATASPTMARARSPPLPTIPIASSDGNVEACQAGKGMGRRAKSAKIVRDDADSSGSTAKVGSQSMKEFRPSTASAIQSARNPILKSARDIEYSAASFTLDQAKKYKPPKPQHDQTALSKLPADVLTDTCKQLSMDRGLKFLRAVSADSKKYDNLVVKKRTHR
jgi:hypothetical protein